MPFVRIEGASLLRLDFAALTVHAGGRVFPLESLWLFLLAGLALVMLFLLVTMAFGRAWCGWGCPQTTLVDLVEWSARRLGIKVAAGRLTATVPQGLLLHVVCLGIALLVGINLVWYFVPPHDFFPHLAAGTLHWAAWVFIAAASAAVYLDLAFLRRLVCREFCPYGRFQTVLVDAGTLTLSFHPDEAARCIRCGACVRACPTGIDIRRGDQIECINCGRCLDACRKVMAGRGQPGIIRYTFGLEGRGGRALLNPRTALVTVALLAIVAVLATATVQRAPLTLKAARSATLLPRIVEGGGVVNFFTVYLHNRSDREQTVRFAIGGGLPDVQWRGPAERQQLGAGEHRRIDFGLVTAAGNLGKPQPVELAVLDDNGGVLAATTLTLVPPLDTAGGH